jgi:hypothetical protein
MTESSLVRVLTEVLGVLVRQQAQIQALSARLQAVECDRMATALQPEFGHSKEFRTSSVQTHDHDSAARTAGCGPEWHAPSTNTSTE